ncbi:serine/threonine-protein kinase CTR1 [Mercurialis annua]|uniref:serine/threonine-protein kinase CTR1 n=1 Tax=Mercurialis annua TaxID=3986 RepID=UPI0021607F1B|nr:serine/threonine-protein kinase CTR1 [Mercurialis annua]
MEMPGRRSNNYTLLNQYPDDQHLSTAAAPPPYYESSDSKSSSNNNTTKLVSKDWEANSNRLGNIMSGNLLYPSSSIGLQRQSSGSSFGESSLSGEYVYAPNLSTTTTATGGGNNEMIDAASFGGGYSHEDGSGNIRVRTVDTGMGMGNGSSGKSWAQQTEESYQLQLALALRLSSEATCADDPNFLDPVPDESTLRGVTSGSNSPEALSHRIWVNGCLSYFDKIPDGFYLIYGMDPYVWTVCTDLQETGRIPSIESLKSVDPAANSSLEVVLVDRRTDSSLKELQNRVHGISCNCITTKEVVDQLAKLVCSRMGGSSIMGEDYFTNIWRECSEDLKDCLGSVVVPIGSLSVGLCRHRALLFKVLADTIDLPCRIARGCKYCKRDDASSCLVRFGVDREYLVDLIGKPGCLCEPDSLLNGPSSISISSPLRFPRMKSAEPNVDFRSLAKQYFADCQLLNIVFDDASAGNIHDGEASGFSMYAKQQIEKVDADRNNLVNNATEISQLPLPMKVARTGAQGNSHMIKSYNLAQDVKQSTNMGKDLIPLKNIPTTGHRDPLLLMPDHRADTSKSSKISDGSQVVSSRSSKEFSLDVEDLDIPWCDLNLKERIGAGSFGTVHRADWHGSDVAVKILMEQDFHAERFKEFLREVSIMKRLRHPNIVLFMGAVTQPPNLSIVTEYLSRGSLYRLLHKSGAREVLDERRRLSMAYDVAKGMNYLHKRNPPIVHRDLKSPNLLVDKKYTVKVCDFGLSRLKANTFLSSKSAAGTPEWMAPEVLRDEPSNEKSDVYSFGVILWEIATLQQPWGNLNPAQVVAAVGFKGRRLEIPRDLNPHVASIIEACWANEPWKRPSFATIMETLRPLIKAPTPPTGHADLPLLT